MAVTNIPNVQNWTVTPQNGQPSYFTLMNTWLGQSTLVIASLQTAIAAQNIANNQINELAIQTENNAIIATGLANFQGEHRTSVTYSKGQSIEYPSGSKIYYTSKVDNNLNHAVTDTNYWLYSPINDKLNTDFSLLTDKATPSDTDIFAIRESGGLLKKLSWANLKATLKTYFDSLYMSLTGNQTVDGNKSFTGNVLISSTAGVLGYANGSGLSVGQLTNKNTSVSCPSPTGTIITSNSALAAGETAQFSVFCPYVTEQDTIQVNCKYAGGIGTLYDVNAISSNGDFLVQLKNKDTITRADSVYITYTILKGTLV